MEYISFQVCYISGIKKRGTQSILQNTSLKVKRVCKLWTNQSANDWHRLNRPSTAVHNKSLVPLHRLYKTCKSLVSLVSSCPNLTRIGWESLVSYSSCYTTGRRRAYESGESHSKLTQQRRSDNTLVWTSSSRVFDLFHLSLSLEKNPHSSLKQCSVRQDLR